MIWYEILHTLAQNILYTFKTFCVCRKKPPHYCFFFSFMCGSGSNATQEAARWDSNLLTKCNNSSFILKATPLQPLS
jgi:hypothetical protein